MATEYSVRTAATPTPSGSSAAGKGNALIPSRGERIEFLRFGISLRGAVSSADRWEIRVRLDDGETVVLSPGRDHYRIVPFH